MAPRKKPTPKKRKPPKPRTSERPASVSTVPSSRPSAPAPLYSEDATTENTDGVGRGDGGLH